MPCSMVPVLEIGNQTQVPQSRAIASYLAREFGYHGNTNMEMARVDFICDCFYDVMEDFMRMYQDKEGKVTKHELNLQNQKLRDVFQKSTDIGSSSAKRMRYNETIRKIIPFMERTLEMYNNGNKYFMGEQITMADMMCYCALENSIIDDTALLSSYPKLEALRNRVMNHPNLCTYLQKRCKTEF